MLNKDIIAFRKGMLVQTKERGITILPSKEASLFMAYPHIMTLQAELMRLGFMLDTEAIGALTDKDECIAYYNTVIPYIKEFMADGDYQPIYKGFPQEVMEKSDLELFCNAICHYWTQGQWMPTTWTGTKATIFENVNYKVIKVVTEEEFDNIFTQLVSVNQSLAPFDKEVVEWFVNEHTKKGKTLIMPETIPFKETLCLLASYKVDGLPVKTPTDVLRIAVHMSGGDISLPAVPKAKSLQRVGWSMQMLDNPERDNFKFKKFTRSERKYLLYLLDNTSCNLGEMKGRINRWIRLGEILHPGEYSTKFKKAFKAFNTLRNDAKSIKTWNSEVTVLLNCAKEANDTVKLMNEKPLEYGGQALVISQYAVSTLNALLDKLCERPGEFARRLDSLVRTFPFEIVMGEFFTVGRSVSNKVLFELYGHFTNRKEEVSERTIFIKGKSKPTKIKPLVGMNSKTSKAIKDMLLMIITANFADKEAMDGKYYIDPKLKKLPCPTNMRSMNDGLMVVPRGARIPMGETAKCMRFYTHWEQLPGKREDLDLSAFLMNREGKRETIGWNSNYKTGYGCFSGDVRYVPGHCAEYVDIMVDNALENGFEYVVMNLNNYEGRPLNTLPCTMGWMEREFPEANKTWKPDTVANSIKISSPNISTTLCIIDLKNKDVIYVDESNDRCVANSGSGNYLLDIINRYTEVEMLSVYDILKMNIEARGGVISDKPFEIQYTETSGEEKIVNEVEVELPKFTFEEFFADYTKVLTYML